MAAAALPRGGSRAACPSYSRALISIILTFGSRTWTMIPESALARHIAAVAAVTDGMSGRSLASQLQMALFESLGQPPPWYLKKPIRDGTDVRASRRITKLPKGGKPAQTS